MSGRFQAKLVEPSEAMKRKSERVMGAYALLANLVDDDVPDCAERNAAFYHLELSALWVNKAILEGGEER